MIWFLVGVLIGYAGFRLLARFGVLCWLSHHRYKFDLMGIAICRRCGRRTIEGFASNERLDANNNRIVD